MGNKRHYKLRTLRIERREQYNAEGLLVCRYYVVQEKRFFGWKEWHEVVWNHGDTTKCLIMFATPDKALHAIDAERHGKRDCTTREIVKHDFEI